MFMLCIDILFTFRLFYLFVLPDENHERSEFRLQKDMKRKRNPEIADQTEIGFLKKISFFRTSFVKTIKMKIIYKLLIYQYFM